MKTGDVVGINNVVGINPHTTVEAMARRLYRVAEEAAYNEAGDDDTAAQAGNYGTVTGERIHVIAMQQLEQIEKRLVELIQKEHMGG